ncbi:MAG: triose-phosphate isomerase [Candidatus Aenigmarchaeota archaeon]|nr:triose-phosphate isomerase [Candidatus Aenigmarchaeota archaeon]
MVPIIVINFKTYETATGKKAVELAKIIEEFVGKADVIVCPQFTDLKAITDAVKIPVFAQHIDPVKFGSYTGHVLPESVKEAGCFGTLINHAERRIDMATIKACIERAKYVGLTTICCVPSIEDAEAVVAYKPDYIAFEEPSLISSGKSISKTEPDAVKEFAEAISKTSSIPLCGAGVSNGEDVRAAIDLGTKGVLLASAVTKAVNPRTVMEDLVSLI